MMKGVVLYSSKYGSAKQYAQWISEELGFEIYECKEVKKFVLSSYDCLVFGSSIYAGMMRAAKVLKNKWGSIKDKKIYLFSVGDTKIEDTRTIEEIWIKNLTKDIYEQIQCCHFRGRSDFSKLSTVHKMIISMISKTIKDEDERKRMTGCSDFMSKEAAIAFTKNIKEGCL